jgi:FkbH-like protein
MLKELEYPYDSEFILKKKRSLKKKIEGREKITKRIAVLGGSTTSAIIDILELFLLNQGIRPEFYESEYNNWWEDAVFESGNKDSELAKFSPDLVYIHTSERNIKFYPTPCNSNEEVQNNLLQDFGRFQQAWNSIRKNLKCPVIQNNFERPQFRLMGNRDVWDFRGRTNYSRHLNEKFYQYADEHSDFYINDLDYLSSNYGLDNWHDKNFWYIAKYCCAYNAIPDLAYSVASIIKAIFGKNKKALVMDLDNTMWGGVIGDDGVDNLRLDPVSAEGEAYGEFQKYIKLHKDLGIILNVVSKNEEENAITGLKHPDSNISPEDFTIITANWDNKYLNIAKQAKTLDLGADSFVFVDDNPAERAIVKEQIEEIAAPRITPDNIENLGVSGKGIEDYIRILDNSHFFETVVLSEDDLKKSKQYKQKAQAAAVVEDFGDYNEFLKSLNMKAEIQDFKPVYMERITQLTNKSNQFNLTTKRYTENQMQEVADSNNYIRLYGKLEDKFGDNGLVSVIIGEKKKTNELHIDLWLMSCRVLKRDMELAMLDTLICEAKKQGITEIYGYYYPTAKNSMVKDFFNTVLGFDKISESVEGNIKYFLNIKDYKNKCQVILVNEKSQI